jgi:hypothetical protein
LRSRRVSRPAFRRRSNRAQGGQQRAIVRRDPAVDAQVGLFHGANIAQALRSEIDLDPAHRAVELELSKRLRHAGRSGFDFERGLEFGWDHARRVGAQKIRGLWRYDGCQRGKTVDLARIEAERNRPAW